MSFFSAIGDFTKSAIGSVGSFFKSDTFNTAKTIAKGASDVIGAMRTAAGKVDLSEPPTGLVNPNIGLSGRMTGTSRSRAGTPSFGDIGEATYSRYKSIAKDRS